MKALVYLGPGKMEFRETEKPSGEVILRVLGSGVCGTDIKTFLKGHHMFTPPTVLGHECVGIVESAVPGSGVSPGEWVAVAPYLECGSCGTCAKGIGQLCRDKTYVSGGCFAEYISMDSGYALRGLFHVETPDPVHTLAEPLACVVNGMEKLCLDAGRTTLIVGAGPMGSLFGALLESLGKPFAFVEPSPYRRDLIAGFGWEVLSAEDAKAAAFDQIVLTVNRGELVQEYIGAAADGGNLLLFSGFSRSDRATVDPYDIHYREVSVTGTFGYARGHFIEALDILDREAPRFGRLVTHRMPLSQGLDAMALLQKGEAMKIVLEP
jgi:L-iditol 2-dehydrogenase